MRLIYENPASSAPLLFLAKRKFISRIYGAYCRTPMSARKIPDFIREYQVDMSGCAESYKNFADFFSRAKTGVSFPAEPDILGSPCEGLVSVHTDINPCELIAAKGSSFSLSELFGDAQLAASYKGGTMVRIRLTPANYHRMHFFDDGVITDAKFINGNLFSVNPLALARVARLYCRNKRALILFSSKNFGEVAMVEVGATFVGSITHCFETGEPVRRGQQASVFSPGGSLLLMFFKPGELTPLDSILTQTAAGYESKIQAGAPIS